MIRSFRDRDTQRVWEGHRSRSVPPEIQDRALNKLRILNRAASLEELRGVPGNHLE